MENVLYHWMEENISKLIPMSTNCVTNQAIVIYQKIKKEFIDLTEAEKSKTFNGSKGWLQKYKDRNNLHNVLVNGESKSADTEAGKKYPIKFEKIVKDGNYSDSQLFKIDETSLYIKKMPHRTYLTAGYKSMNGRKKAKNRLSILLSTKHKLFLNF